MDSESEKCKAIKHRNEKVKQWKNEGKETAEQEDCGHCILSERILLPSSLSVFKSGTSVLLLYSFRWNSVCVAQGGEHRIQGMKSAWLQPPGFKECIQSGLRTQKCSLVLQRGPKPQSYSIFWVNLPLWNVIRVREFVKKSVLQSLGITMHKTV